MLSSSNNLSKTSLAIGYNRLGLAYFDEGLYAQAIRSFGVSISLNSGDARAYNNRGLAYQKLGEYEQSSHDYTKAISIDPNCATAYHNRGGIYYFQNEYTKAIRDFNKAIQLDPTLSDEIESFLAEVQNEISLQQRLDGCYPGDEQSEEIANLVRELNLVDPVSLELMNDPRTLACNHSLDFSTLQKIVERERENTKCPCCRAPVNEDFRLHPPVNQALKLKIFAFVEAQTKKTNNASSSSAASLNVQSERNEIDSSAAGSEARSSASNSMLSRARESFLARIEKEAKAAKATQKAVSQVSSSAVRHNRQ